MAGEDEAGLTTPGAEQADQDAEVQRQAEQTVPPSPGFGERGRMRRRARFLRKARELAYRDLGGLVYDLHRFGQRNDQIVLAKLATLGRIDAELRALEQALHEIKPLTVLHEVGIAACPRCAAIHGNEDHFCPGCGLAFAADAERPLATAPVTAATPATAAADTPAAGASAATTPAASKTSPAGAGASTDAATTHAPAPAAPRASASVAADAWRARAATPTARAAAPQPAAEPFTTIERPAAAPPKPMSPPVAARPPAEADGDGKGGQDRGGSDNQAPGPEEEQTQILRPPAGSA